MPGEVVLKRVEKKIDRLQEDVEYIKTDHGEKIDRLQRTVDEHGQQINEIHRTVVLIEKDHGEKIEALFDGHDVLSNRIYRVEQRLDMQRMCLDDFEQNLARLESGQVRLESGQQEIKSDVREIKRHVEQLASIAGDHEDRLQLLEKKKG